MKTCVGGTFNTVHKGHEALLKAAFAASDEVGIGLTSDEFAAQNKKWVTPFAERKASLLHFLAGKGWEAEVKKISDVYGFATEKECGAIVVSEETLPNAHLINLRRSELGLPNLKIVVVPIIKNEKGEKISSSG